MFEIMGARYILSKNLAQVVIIERETHRLQALRGLVRQGIKDEQKDPPARLQGVSYLEEGKLRATKLC
jgi:hypothetical protein